MTIECMFGKHAQFCAYTYCMEVYNKAKLPPLHPVPVLDATSPLSLVTTDLEYQPASPTAGITVALRDDDIALEEEEQLSLGILLTSSECYDFTITPTQITILDNDGMPGLILHTIANVCA